MIYDSDILINKNLMVRRTLWIIFSSNKTRAQFFSFKVCLFLNTINKKMNDTRKYFSFIILE